MLDKLMPTAEAILPSGIKKRLKRLLPASSQGRFNFMRNANAERGQATYLLHTGEQDSAGRLHLSMWLPTLVAYQTDYQLSFAVIVRNMSLYTWVNKAYPKVACYFCRRLMDIEKVMAENPQVKACLHPSSTQRMLHMISIESLTHVFIGHGDSDKQSSVRKSMRMCDEMWVAGQAHIDRFKSSKTNFDSLKFKIVGRPALKKILQAGNHTSKTKGKVLYLPTWEGAFETSNYSSVELMSKLEQAVKAEKSGFHIDAKFHPHTGSRLSHYASLAKQIGKRHIFSKIIDTNQPLLDLLLAYDAFVCDYSSVITEVLSTGKPIFVYTPSNKATVTATSKLTYEDYCYSFSNIQELYERMQKVLTEGKDDLAEKRQQALSYFIGVKETLNDTFVQELTQLTEQAI